MSTPDALMRTATESAYLLDHPGDEAGGVVAGWLAANRVAARAGGFATVSPETQAALSRVNVAEIERWLDAVWGDVTGTIVEVGP